MPKKINLIRKALLKKSLLAGNTKKQAFLDAGYKKITAEHNITSDNRLLKAVETEICEDIKKQVTVESVLKSLKTIQRLAIKKGDFSSATRCEELCGKWLAMFTDKQEISEIEKEDNQFSLSRLLKIKSDISSEN